MGRTVVRILGSNGQREARVSAVATIPTASGAPAPQTERVQIVDPRETSTVVSGVAVPAGPGPRNPEQHFVRTVECGIDLPDALPATKAQRVIIDPELVARWRAEADAKRNS